MQHKKTLFRFLLSGLILLAQTPVSAQQSYIYTHPDKTFRDAQQFFQDGKYAVAMQLFKKTLGDINYFQQTNRQLVYQDAQYYYAVCALELNQPDGETLTKKFIEEVDNQPRKELASFHLARYYFHQNKLKEAIPYYEQAGIANLSNNEIADAKFELGYCYFNLKDFNKAQPLFASIKDVQGKYYIPANYYYGFIAYYNKQYDEALQSFQRVVNEKKYDIIVPYYIAEIYYYQNKPDKVLDYALPYIQKGNLYYDLDLKHLVGQTYFEKKEYAKALPYLEAYQDNTDHLQKEDVYELAYCYYQTNQLPKAISGFKQLSGTTDSLGQNSMYLLGDCYLKTDQKANARNAFAFCARSNYNPRQQEISRFNYGKLSYELGYQDAALQELKSFVRDYPGSAYDAEAKEILAHLFMNTNDYKNALTIVESIPDKTPSVRQAYQKVAYGRAMQLVNDGQLNEASGLLDVSLQNPSDAQLQQLAYFWKGEISLRQGKYDDAITNINRYFTLGQPGTPAASGEANVQTANYNLGYCLLQKGNYQEALTHLQQAQSVFGANGDRIANDATLRAADCYYMLKDYNNALNLYNKVISGRQQGADYATYQKGLIMGINGDYNQKVSLLKQLSQQYPASSFNTDADYEIAVTYINNQQYQEAIPYLQNVIKNEPNSPDAPKALLKLGLAYQNLNDNNNALTYYKQVVTQYPNSPESNDALQSLRTLYISSGNTDAFLSFLKSTGKNINPSVEDSVTYAAAETKFGNGDYDGALTAFNNYLSKFPAGQFILNANFYKAECLYSKQDYTNALPAYEYVLSQGTNRFNERSALQAAKINFYQVKNYTKSRLYFQQLKDLATTKENSLEALRGLLRSDYQLQSWDEVKMAANNLLAADNISTDDQIVSHFYLGKAYQAGSNCDTAIAEFKKVASLTKSELGAEARYDIAQCNFLQNDFKAAEKAAFEVIKTTPSYDYWIASAYILLGDIYLKEKDYFNAKATLQSIVDNCKIPELVAAARDKLNEVVAQEKAGSKIKDTNQ